MPKILRDYTPPLSGKKFRVRDVAYMAGIIDGEGCITATKYPQLRIEVANTSKILIDWCKENFGGYVYTREPIAPHGNRTFYIWYASASDMVALLKLLIPHLKIKKKEAMLALVFRGCQLQGISDAKLQRLAARLRAMKRMR